MWQTDNAWRPSTKLCKRAGFVAPLITAGCPDLIPAKHQLLKWGDGLKSSVIACFFWVVLLPVCQYILCKNRGGKKVISGQKMSYFTDLGKSLIAPFHSSICI